MQNFQRTFFRLYKNCIAYLLIYIMAVNKLQLSNNNFREFIVEREERANQVLTLSAEGNICGRSMCSVRKLLLPFRKGENNEQKPVEKRLALDKHLAESTSFPSFHESEEVPPLRSLPRLRKATGRIVFLSARVFHFTPTFFFFFTVTFFYSLSLPVRSIN